MLQSECNGFCHVLNDIGCPTCMQGKIKFRSGVNLFQEPLRYIAAPIPLRLRISQTQFVLKNAY
jgi:hypothetical protein